VPPLAADERARLVEHFAADVAAVAELFPEIDLALWPHFAAIGRR
jgi:hypothetical protein